MVSAPGQTLKVNPSNLWYGDNDGIEVVWNTGENLAYTDDDPKIDPPHPNTPQASLRRGL
jgi:hypothetical protein